jgi:hypothetical protein
MSSLILTVYFDGSFWVGLLERREHQSAYFHKVVFGAEPSGGVLLQWLHHELPQSDFVAVSQATHQTKLARNPKRRQREAAAQTSARCPGTSSREALKKAYEFLEMNANCRKAVEQRRIRDVRFEQRQKKQKEKRRGR